MILSVLFISPARSQETGTSPQDKTATGIRIEVNGDAEEGVEAAIKDIKDGVKDMMKPLVEKRIENDNTLSAADKEEVRNTFKDLKDMSLVAHTDDKGWASDVVIGLVVIFIYSEHRHRFDSPVHGTGPVTDLETFIWVFRSLHQFRGNAKFFTWVYRIAYNCFAAHYRSSKVEVSFDESIPVERGYLPDGETDLHRDFARALHGFAPQQRMALHLFYQREFTHSEIAEIMNIPLGTVKSHIQRGREKLRQRPASWHDGD